MRNKLKPAVIRTSDSRDDWETPQDLFDKLDKEFHFTLDAAASCDNAKCERFFSLGHDGLFQLWEGVVWVNPPYGREVGKWVAKAHSEWLSGCTVVMLLAARTDTKWFHKYIYGHAEIRFLKGRIKFVGGKHSAPFPSMVVVFKGK